MTSLEGSPLAPLILSTDIGRQLIAACLDHVPLSQLCAAHNLSSGEVAHFLDQADLDSRTVESYLLTWTPLAELLAARRAVGDSPGGGPVSHTQSLILQHALTQ